MFNRLILRVGWRCTHPEGFRPLTLYSFSRLIHPAIFAPTQKQATPQSLSPISPLLPSAVQTASIKPMRATIVQIFNFFIALPFLLR